MQLAHHVMTWSGYSKKQDRPFDLDTACRETRDAGYDGIELAADPDTNGSAEETQATLDRHGLSLAALATGVTLNPHPPATDKFRIACEYAQQLGIETLMVCGGFNSGKRRHAFEWEYEMFAGNLQDHADLAAEFGCRISYHPHLRCIVETDAELDRLLRYRPDIDLCIDTGHQVAAGTDPLALLRKHSQRVTHVHLKDWDPNEEVFTEIGQGSANLDFTAFFEELDRQNYPGWVVVERDGTILPPLESAKLSRTGVQNAMPV